MGKPIHLGIFPNQKIWYNKGKKKYEANYEQLKISIGL